MNIQNITIRELKEWLSLDKYGNKSGVTVENIIIAYNEFCRLNMTKHKRYIELKYFNKII